jgi:hypothetical protein
MDTPTATRTEDIRRTPAGSEKPRAILRGRVAPTLLRDELLCEIFGATASLIPDQPCMYAGDQTFTYAEVDDKATAMARGLVREGVRPGEVPTPLRPTAPTKAVHPGRPSRVGTDDGGRLGPVGGGDREQVWRREGGHQALFRSPSFGGAGAASRPSATPSG